MSKIKITTSLTSGPGNTNSFYKDDIINVIKFDKNGNAIVWAKALGKKRKVLIPKREFEIVNESKKEKISGGLTSGMSLQDIANKHGVSLDYIKSELKKGIKVELEHTVNVNIASEIAKDHLVEFPDYYERLKKIEERVINRLRKNAHN